MSFTKHIYTHVHVVNFSVLCCNSNEMQLLLRVSKIDYFPSDKYWNCLRLSAHHANSLIVLLSSRSRSHGLNLCKWAFVPHLLNYWTCLPQTWYAGVSLPDWPVKSLGILSTVSRWQGSNPQKMGLHHISSDLLKLLRPNLVLCYASSWWSVMQKMLVAIFNFNVKVTRFESSQVTVCPISSALLKYIVRHLL